MNQQDSTHGNEPYILIEGPKWGDAEFYGNWLLMAAKAEALWWQALEDTSFAKQMELATICGIPSFACSATNMLFQLEKNLTSITVGLNEDDIFEFNAFSMMVEMGFFVLTGERYQMVIPKKVTIENVKMAALKFSRTEDEDGILRPENIVATMPYAEAKAWQARLSNMDTAHRCADRLSLLED